jgi:biotin operon repressor
MSPQFDYIIIIRQGGQMQNRDNPYTRAELKSYEGEFLYELQNSYELSPRLSEQLLISAKTSLLQTHKLQKGQVTAVAADLEEKSGKPIEKVRKTTVILTLHNGQDDIRILQCLGRSNLRQFVIQRITEEAVEQGGILTQEDLSYYLSCSVRTIKRDINAIRNRGIEVITRGVFHNVGRGQSHKSKIINFYLDGFTYSEIKRKTRHSISSIRRYLESFSKVLMSLHYGITDISEISSITGLSEYLINQYQQIISDSQNTPTRKRNLSILLEQAQYRNGIKKRIRQLPDGLQAEVTQENKI